MSKNNFQNKSVDLVFGLILGGIIGTVVSLLYKTEKGKKIKKKLLHYYNDIDVYSRKIIQQAEKESKEIKKKFNESNQSNKQKSFKARKQKITHFSRVFQRLGKPLRK